MTHRCVILREPIPMPRARVTKNGTFVPRPAALERDALRAELEAWWNGVKLAGPVALRVLAYLKMPKRIPLRDRPIAMPDVRPDADNLGRMITDAGTGVIWQDDSQLVDVWVRKRYAAFGDTGRWELEVYCPR